MASKTIKEDALRHVLGLTQQLMAVELSCEVMGVLITLRSLTATERHKILKDIAGFQNRLDYSLHVRLSLIARSIVQIGDTDLRGVDFVQVTEDGKTSKIEVQEYLRKFVVSKWSESVITVLEKKVDEVINLSEKKASEGIVFEVDETDYEGRFRNLLSEARDVANNLPDGIIDRVLNEYGWIRGVSQKEGAELDIKLKGIKDETETQSDEPKVDPMSSSVQAPQQPSHNNTSKAEHKAEPAPLSSSTDAGRESLANQYDVSGIPLREPPVGPEPPKKVAGIESSAPATFHDLNSSRSRRVAMLEEGLDADASPTIVLGKNPSAAQQTTKVVPVDLPPAGGINPRFKRALWPPNQPKREKTGTRLSLVFLSQKRILRYIRMLLNC